MEPSTSFEAGGFYDQFGFSSADATPRFAPGAMDLIEIGWNEEGELEAFNVIEEPVEPTTAAPSASFGTRIRARHVEQISQIDREDWNRLFPDMAENWEYFTACEASNPDMLRLSAMVVFDGETLVGAVPVFYVDYRLDMSLPSALKGFGTLLERVAPKLLRMPVLGFGSPMSETCSFGFSPELTFDEKKTVLKEIVSGLLDYAKDHGVKLSAFKDVSEKDRAFMDEVLSQFGYARMGSLPIATLELPFENRDAYLNSLSRNMKKSLKRKLKQSRDVKVEVRSVVEKDLLAEIVELYKETRANRSSSFEGFDEVTDSYFQHVMENLNGKARVMLFRIEGQLIGFNLFLQEKDRVIGKFVGMNYALSRKYNIYFLNWLEMVSYCLKNDISELQAGQTTYELKSQLGCKLKRSWIYFRHEGRFLGFLFRTVGAKFGLDLDDPDLKKLGSKVIYVS